MLKFKFNYQENTLAYQKHDLWYQIAEDQQFAGNFGSLGFNLDSGWINFTVYPNKIRVFYKQMSHGQDLTDFWEPQSIAYFRKDLPKTCPVIFTFTEADKVEKLGNKWIKKGGQRGK